MLSQKHEKPNANPKHQIDLNKVSDRNVDIKYIVILDEWSSMWNPAGKQSKLENRAEEISTEGIERR